MLAITLSYLTLLLGPIAHDAAKDRAPAGRPPGLTLRLVDPQNLLPAGTREVGSEVTRLFAELDVPVRWHWHGESEAPSGYPLRVVLLPSEPGATGWDLPANALGVTVSDGVRSAPAVYVFYPRLLRSLGVPQREARLPSNLELRRMTRALGRVIAHEIFHALAPGHPHAETGLMSASFSDALLVGEEVEVDARWAALLHRQLEGLASRSVLE